jgi:RNA polymerase sigma factor (sigma-70 family)
MKAAPQQLWHYEDGYPHMSPRSLFEANLDVIERAIAQVCRQVRLHGADAEDFASTARVALLDDDCAILRKYESRSSLSSYVAIVIRRLFISQKRTMGRWHPSAEATRRGEAAMTLDRLLHHEGRSLDEALAITKAKHPDANVRQLELTAEILPHRLPRPRLVPVIEGDEDRFAGAMAADDRVLTADLDKRAAQTSRAVQSAMETMSAEDRVILRLRYAKTMAISDIARALGISQRPLYRRLDALLAKLKAALAHAGIDDVDAAQIIGGGVDRLDFGMGHGKTSEAQPSDQSENR